MRIILLSVILSFSFSLFAQSTGSFYIKPAEEPCLIIGDNDTWINAGGCPVTGNGSLEMGSVGCVNGWANSAISTTAVSPDLTLSFTLASITANHAQMVGLNSIQTNNSWTDLDFALYFFNAGGALQVRVYESGTFQGTFAAYSAGDEFEIEIVGNTVTYYQNGTSFYTHAITPASSYFFDSSLLFNGFYNNTAVYENITICTN